MCGIAGIVGSSVLANEGFIRAMVSCLRHRGPDGTGIDVFPNAVLGHARLSIVDLSTGAQPMRDASGKHSITFNGEIYGYLDIRKQLNYLYKTDSDTEVILALYQKYGIGMISYLPGMFAFAIWDEEEQILFAARDRFGEKPFYYSLPQDGKYFVFASEIKAILASKLVRPVLNRKAMAHFLNRLYVPVGGSIYSTILQLPPAHALIFKDGKVKTWRYWDLPPTRKNITLSDAVEEFKYLFSESVKKQLVADVEVGAFLSGGLDSSSVVAAAVEHAPTIRTFSFGFTDGPSEIEYARQVSSMHRTEHVELFDTQGSLASLVESMADVYDEPFGDSSAIPTYMICRQARRHLKVVLTGDGGDENLGGYPWYRFVAYHGKLEGRAAWVNALHYFLMRSCRRVFGGGKNMHRNLQTFNRFRAGSAASETHRRLRDFVSKADLKQAGLDINLSPYRCGSDAVDSAMRTDLSDFMAGDILVKIDRAAMAHGLELRAPFLDVDLASFTISLPSSMKIVGKVDKVLLREAFRNKWPRSLQRRGKQGFGAPVRQWFQRAELRDLKHCYLADKNQPVRQILGGKFVDTVAARDDDGTWGLMMLAIWAARKPFELN